MYTKTICVQFIKTKKELNLKFKVFDNVISDKHVKSFTKNEYKPKKVQSQLTNMVIYDIETFNSIKCIAYAKYIYRLSKNSGKYKRETKRI